MYDAVVKGSIRKMAEDAGFSLCHVTRPRVAAVDIDALQQWAEKGMQGDMGWMAEPVRLERRMKPESMLDDVKSVIVVAMPYTPPSYGLDEALAHGCSGLITAYAHGDDYHDIMKKRLKGLASDLDRLLGLHDQRVFVDTAPVLEHALAGSAGLGWQGKHSLTINRHLGSWFLLGEIFTTADLEPDVPATNHCGSCCSCIHICPTDAIVAPYVVDARRCISYLTIEFDGFIPAELRSLMGNRIYGCDDCQMICPWNEHASKSEKLVDDLLKPRGENNLPELASLLLLDDEAFRDRFRKSPIKRTKRKGLLRNVCIAMGNSACGDYIPLLVRSLEDPEPLIRGHAAWALARLADRSNGRELLDALERCARTEKDVAVTDELSCAIKDIKELL